MATTTSRSARYAKWLSIPLGLLISALLIWQASYAAFTDTAESNGNYWSAGDVKVSHDHETSLIFAESYLAPGDSGIEYVTAKYTGSADADIRFYSRGLDLPSELADSILLTIRGSWGESYNEGSSGEVFQGSLTTFAAENPNYEDAKLAFPFVEGRSNPVGTFQFTYTFTPGADVDVDSLQNQRTEIDFVIEARSVPSN